MIWKKNDTAFLVARRFTELVLINIGYLQKNQYDYM